MRSVCYLARSEEFRGIKWSTKASGKDALSSSLERHLYKASLL